MRRFTADALLTIMYIIGTISAGVCFVFWWLSNKIDDSGGLS